jgi:hypothetical protein
MADKGSVLGFDYSQQFTSHHRVANTRIGHLLQDGFKQLLRLSKSPSKPLIELCLTRYIATMLAIGVGFCLTTTSSLAELPGQPKAAIIDAARFSSLQAALDAEIFIQGISVDRHGGHGINLLDCTENPRVADSMITYNARAGLNIVTTDLIAGLLLHVDQHPVMHQNDEIIFSVTSDIRDDCFARFCQVTPP